MNFILCPATAEGKRKPCPFAVVVTLTKLTQGAIAAGPGPAIRVADFSFATSWIPSDDTEAF